MEIHNGINFIGKYGGFTDTSSEETLRTKLRKKISIYTTEK
jgi:hypothetical protein